MRFIDKEATITGLYPFLSRNNVGAAIAPQLDIPMNFTTGVQNKQKLLILFCPAAGAAASTAV